MEVGYEDTSRSGPGQKERRNVAVLLTHLHQQLQAFQVTQRNHAPLAACVRFLSTTGPAAA